jgi:NAD(P)-dependent dehydrogenase (short-subunit alcohol dehydrogenase family)
VCLFTGVSGTLGRCFAARHAGAYKLIGVYHATEPDVPFEGLDKPEPLGAGSIHAVRVDLDEPDAAEDLVKQVVERFGSVDLLVNAAVFRRFGRTRNRAFTESLPWQFHLNVCVPAQLAGALTRRAWRHTPDENRARRRNIVNLSSTSGHIVYPGSPQSGYGATKAALNRLTMHLADEMGDIGVRANAIAPNTFPDLVSTEQVTDAILRYDAAAANGEILVIDTDGEHLLPNARWPDCEVDHR